MKDTEGRSECGDQNKYVSMFLISYLLEEISFETAVELMSFPVSELSLAIHLPITEGASVFVTLRPIENAFPIQNVSVEAT